MFNKLHYDAQDRQSNRRNQAGVKKRQQGHSSEQTAAADDSNYSLNGSCFLYAKVSMIAMGRPGKRFSKAPGCDNKHNRT